MRGCPPCCAAASWPRGIPFQGGWRDTSPRAALGFLLSEEGKQNVASVSLCVPGVASGQELEGDAERAGMGTRHMELQFYLHDRQEGGDIETLAPTQGPPSVFGQIAADLVCIGTF